MKRMEQSVKGNIIITCLTVVTASGKDATLPRFHSGTKLNPIKRRAAKMIRAMTVWSLNKTFSPNEAMKIRIVIRANVKTALLDRLVEVRPKVYKKLPLSLLTVVA